MYARKFILIIVFAVLVFWGGAGSGAFALKPVSLHDLNTLETKVQDQYRAIIDPLAPLSFLLGHCWQAVLPEVENAVSDQDDSSQAPITDTHCYSASFGGTLISDYHIITGEAAPYCGEMRYSFAPPQFEDDDKNGVILFRYYSVFGDVSDGFIETKGRKILYPEEIYEDEKGNPVIFRTHLDPAGNQAYDVVTQQKKGAVWENVNKVRFVQTDSPTYPYPEGFRACSQ